MVALHSTLICYTIQHLDSTLIVPIQLIRSLHLTPILFYHCSNPADRCPWMHLILFAIIVPRYKNLVIPYLILTTLSTPTPVRSFQPSLPSLPVDPLLTSSPLSVPFIPTLLSKNPAVIVTGRSHPSFNQNYQKKTRIC